MMGRARAFLAIVVVSLLVLPSFVSAETFSHDEEGGRRWPTGPCRSKPAARPAILEAFFDGWGYRDALRALRRSRVPTKVMKRNGRRYWDEATAAPGKVGKLVPAARRLRRQERSSGRPRRPHVQIVCAGVRAGGLYVTKGFTIWIPKGMRAREVIARHGGREKVTYRYGFGHKRLHMWDLRRRPHSGTVQRAIRYLNDEDVYLVEVHKLRGTHASDD